MKPIIRVFPKEMLQQIVGDKMDIDDILKGMKESKVLSYRINGDKISISVSPSIEISWFMQQLRGFADTEEEDNE